MNNFWFITDEFVFFCLLLFKNHIFVAKSSKIGFLPFIYFPDNLGQNLVFVTDRYASHVESDNSMKMFTHLQIRKKNVYLFSPINSV